MYPIRKSILFPTIGLPGFFLNYCLSRSDQDIGIFSSRLQNQSEKCNAIRSRKYGIILNVLTYP